MLGVWVLPHKHFTVAFRFVQMYDEQNHSSGTTWMPADAPSLIGKLNWVYGLQANISFKLGDVALTRVTLNSDEVDVTQRLTGGNFLKYLAGDQSKTADLTIFFVRNT